MKKINLIYLFISLTFLGIFLYLIIDDSFTFDIKRKLGIIFTGIGFFLTTISLIITYNKKK